MPHIRINHLSYAIPNDKVLFQQLSLTFAAEKTGLVGVNGVGKSSLLKLIMNELAPDSGTIITCGNIAYCPQTLEIPAEISVAQMLTEKQLAKAGLAYLDTGRLFHSLSGGEKTRVVLSKPFSALISPNSFALNELFYAVAS